MQPETAWQVHLMGIVLRPHLMKLRKVCNGVQQCWCSLTVRKRNRVTRW